jgi:hypothetical protein
MVFAGGARVALTEMHREPGDQSATETRQGAAEGADGSVIR